MTKTKLQLDPSILSLKFEEIRERLIDIIKEKACFQEDIILPSGRISDVYLDLRECLLDSEGGLLASLAVLHLIKDEIEFIGGLSSSVYSIAPSVSQFAFIRGQKIDSFFVREQPRQTGNSRWIEGPLKKGSRVCIVQDIVVDGLKIVETMRKIQEEMQIQIIQVIGIVDRMDGASEKLGELGLDYTSICNIEDIAPDASF
jgi:orotate phosphoribosyltransferase